MLPCRERAALLLRSVLELLLGVGISRVFVGVMLQREFPAMVGRGTGGVQRESGRGGGREPGASLGSWRRREFSSRKSGAPDPSGKAGTGRHATLTCTPGAGRWHPDHPRRPKSEARRTSSSLTLDGPAVLPPSRSKSKTTREYPVRIKRRPSMPETRNSGGFRGRIGRRRVAPRSAPIG